MVNSMHTSLKDALINKGNNTSLMIGITIEEFIELLGFKLEQVKINAFFGIAQTYTVEEVQQELDEYNKNKIIYDTH